MSNSATSSGDEVAEFFELRNEAVYPKKIKARLRTSERKYRLLTFFRTQVGGTDHASIMAVDSVWCLLQT